MIINGDCFEEIKKLKDNSIDLVITSPPYTDIVNYGKKVSIKKPNEYVEWILPLFKEILRVASFENRSQASKATGLNEFDIMRCYNRHRKSRWFYMEKRIKE